MAFIGAIPNHAAENPQGTVENIVRDAWPSGRDHLTGQPTQHTDQLPDPPLDGLAIALGISRVLITFGGGQRHDGNFPGCSGL
jgi:hypothetical protein